MHAQELRGRSRFTVLLTAAAATIATIAVPATASPPERGSERSLSIDCDDDGAYVGIFAVEFDDGSALGVFVDTGSESFFFGSLDDATTDGTSVTGTVELFDESTGEPAGTATVDAALTPAGPAESVDDRQKQGNVLERFSATFTPATVTGSVVLEGVLDRTIDLSTCTGRITEVSYFRTNPATYVDRFDERFLDCSIALPDGFGAVFAFESDGEGAFVDVFLERFDGGVVGGSTGDAVFDDTTLAATIELVDFETGEPAGESSVDATLTSLGTRVEQSHHPRRTVKTTIEEFAVTGTLTVDGESLELTDCFAEHREGRVRLTNPPRRVRPVANDLPGDAILLDVPDGDDVDTVGTADEPEAPCVGVFEDEGEVFEFEYPIGHTVWYAFEGTGSPVTIDTAGSLVDTIVGVYDADLGQLACVDDVFEEPDSFSLQAAVTVDTEVGQTYLVQVGGFGFESGPVTVTTIG